MPLPQADVMLNVIRKNNVKGNEGCVWSEMQVFQGPNHPDIVRPNSLLLLLPPFLPLLPLPHDMCVRTRARFIICHLSCSLFPVVRVMDKALSHFGAGRRQRTCPGWVHSQVYQSCPFFCRDP